jgi:HemY protein
MAGRLLGARGDLRKAARLIEAAWREQPHPDLAQVYLHLRHGDSALDRLARAEGLMKLKPLDPESAFAVAEAAIEARDFARARSALSPLVAAIPTVRTCLLMARIEDSEHGSSGRGREWLTRSVRAPRDNAWVADGVVSERWLPVSPISGRLDAFVWTLPPAILGGAGSVLEDWIEPTPAASTAAALEGPAEAEAAPPAAPIVAAGSASTAPPSARAFEAEPLAAPATAHAEALPEPAADLPPPRDNLRVADAASPAGERAPEAPPVAEALPKGPDFSRPPDDPGADPDAPPPRKRSFWGFLSR